MRQIAIIGPTASGKSGLSIEIAKKIDAVILSLDSLSVYKEIDIASAKPSIQERDGIVHFGIDEVYPNEKFDVTEFIECYKRASSYAKEQEKNLVIVGGTGFYLKMLVDGISEGIDISKQTQEWVDEKLLNLKDAYNYMYKIDKYYMQNISHSDSYRIEKALAIYKQSGLSPTEFFRQNPKQSMAGEIKLYEIIWDADELRKRIKLRTKQMIEQGLIDEVIGLEKKYGRDPNSMKAIGIVEVLDYLDGKVTKEQMEEKIIVNTARLAKRQRTFNRSQFGGKQIKNSLAELKKDILKDI